MKKLQALLKLTTMMILLFSAAIQAKAYETAVIYDHNDMIGTNLDLEAVASIFGDSANLSEFERRLNDPYSRISNLDLNGDGYVDYLRLIEVVKHHTHLIVIQSVLGPGLYQDVATIEVGRDYYDRPFVQIVGDPYLYGDYYIVEPVYTYTPVIYRYFWGAGYYRPYYSHYRWGYYPRHYRHWRPAPVHYYSSNIHRHINSRNHYRYTRIRKSHHAREMYRNIRRNDYVRLYRGGSHTHHRSAYGKTRPIKAHSNTHYRMSAKTGRGGAYGKRGNTLHPSYNRQKNSGHTYTRNPRINTRSYQERRTGKPYSNHQSAHTRVQRKGSHTVNRAAKSAQHTHRSGVHSGKHERVYNNGESRR